MSEIPVTPAIEAIQLVNRGTELKGKGRIREALSAFESALVLSPANPLVLTARAETLLSLGNLEKAMEDYEAACAGLAERGFPTADCLVALAEILVRLKSWRRASDLLLLACRDLERLAQGSDEGEAFLLDDFLFTADYALGLARRIRALVRAFPRNDAHGCKPVLRTVQSLLGR